MALGIINSDFSLETDRKRAQFIAGSQGMLHVQGKVGIPFERKEEWPSLMALRTSDCGERVNCTGCERVTKTAAGLVFLLFDNKGESVWGTVCSTSNQKEPYRPIYLQEPVNKQ